MYVCTYVRMYVHICIDWRHAVGARASRRVWRDEYINVCANVCARTCGCTCVQMWAETCVDLCVDSVDMGAKCCARFETCV